MSDNQKNESPALKVKVITIAIGGATCSGKTTLAKHMRNCLYDSFIIHQDDFVPPLELLPIHPVYNVSDWDDAPGAIDWLRFVTVLEYVKRTGILPVAYKSLDHLNENKDVPVNMSIVARWRQESERVAKEYQEKHGVRLVWVIVDGFLLYWNKKVVDQFDIRVFLRVHQDVLKQRRHERYEYYIADGTVWHDPPHYWERIVYPAYERAHCELFEDGDVENGKPTDKAAGLLIFDGLQTTIESMLTLVVEKVLEVTDIYK